MVIWEVTRACPLACKHCRAEAKPLRDPAELNGREVPLFLDQVARTNPALFILSGGDPLSRPDLPRIIELAAARGLHVSLSPSATPRALRAPWKTMRDAGLQNVSFSLDGATRESHDAFRGVRGTWDWTLQAISEAQNAGLGIQINTTFTKANLPQCNAFAKLVAKIAPNTWSAFQIVPTGRAGLADLPSAQELEDLFHWLVDRTRDLPCKIKTTEGQHYRRVAAQRWKADPTLPKPAPIGLNDAKGFVFISHTGDVLPSGFLPLTAGNVRENELGEIYRNAPLFRALRDPDRLRGKCGRCEFRNLCGGSRARSYAVTGDALAEEPLCSYQPPSL